MLIAGIPAHASAQDNTALLSDISYITAIPQLAAMLERASDDAGDFLIDSPALNALPALDFTSFMNAVGEGTNSFARIAHDFFSSTIRTPFQNFLSFFQSAPRSSAPGPTLDDIASLKQDVQTLKAALAAGRPPEEIRAVTERVIERIQPITEITKTLNTETKIIDSPSLARIDAALSDLSSRISSNASRQTATVENISVGQRIDTLRGVTFTGTNNFNLTDADVPDTITASNYLPLSGGTLSGVLAVNANATMNGVLTVSSFAATSTTATSTIATGGFAVGTSQFVVQQTSGNLGIGTTSPSATLSLAGNGYFDSNLIIVGSSTASSFQLAFQHAATTTIPQAINAWSIATSTNATPILSVTGANIGDVSNGSVVIGGFGGNPTFDYAKLIVNGQSSFGEAATFYNLTSTEYSDIVVLSDLAYLSIAAQGTATGNTNLANVPQSVIFTEYGSGGLILDTPLAAPIIFATSGYQLSNERMRINAIGNIGIGTATPLALLSVYGSTTIQTPVNTLTAFQILNSATSTAFVVDTLNTRVGIGTAGPGTRLQVIGSSLSNGETIRIQDTTLTNAASYSARGNGGNAWFGVESSTGGSIFTGTDANAAVLGVGQTGGKIQFAGADGVRMTILSGGNVGIGTTSPDLLLTVGSAAPSGRVAHFENSTGSCYINPTTTSLECTSDIRLKTNIASLADAKGLNALLQLNPVTYNWVNEAAGSSTHTGLIAQQVALIYPDLVSQGPDGYYTMNYAGLTPYLVKAVQELKSEINQLKAVGVASGAADGFSSLLEWLKDKTVQAKEFLAEKITAQKAILEKIELRDEDTGEIYCVRIKSGALLSTPGECRFVPQPALIAPQDASSTTSADALPQGPERGANTGMNSGIVATTSEIIP